MFDHFFGFICSTLEISERLRWLECLLASETFCKWPNKQILMVAHSYTPCPLNVNIDSRHLMDMSWDPACWAPSLSLCMSLCLHDSLPPPLYFGQRPSLLLWPLQKSLLRYLSFSMVSLLPHGREFGSVFTLSPQVWFNVSQRMNTCSECPQLIGLFNSVQPEPCWKWPIFNSFPIWVALLCLS